MFSRIQRTGAIVLAAIVVLLAPQIALAQSDAELLITGDGVGNAVLGQTADELADALGDAYLVSDEARITVDLNGRVISRSGDVQFRAAMTDDSELLSLFIVSNPAYATAEGVGPMTSIADAEAIYGDAMLRQADGGREFVMFENGPDERIAFRTPGIGGNTVGVYDGNATETSEYVEDGAIAAVWVQCEPGSNCPADGGDDPEPTATSEPDPEPTAEPDPEPTATPEPDPEPTAEPDPEPTATPEPDPAPTATPEAADDSDDASSGGGDDSLPRTGVTELLMLAVASVLVLLGGMMVLVERHSGATLSRSRH